MGERKYCYKCMEKYDSGLHICPNCGYDDNTPSNPMYITPGTVLHDRYLIGILLDYNGEGATYAGFDISTGCKVLLREYMPVNLCTRVKGKAVISVNYNNLAKYKAFMAEYTELNKSLARLRNDSNINPVLDMFAENNTTYTVFEHIEGIKMLDYLKENAGELSWEQVSKLFPPLFTTIGRLHNAGIIHRAISPDTIYITEKGELRLSGFCVSAVRTANAGLEYELFKGYAAPEQYSASSSSRQGSWTDVYGICALLYRALTGCMPVDSVSRQTHDDLCEPGRLNANIPPHVSRVIMEGMNLSGRDRIQTITELVTRLFEQPAAARTSMTAPIPVQPPVQNYQTPYESPNIDYQQPPYPQPNDYGYGNQGGYYYDDGSSGERYRYEKVNTVDRLKVPVIIGILLLAILLIIIGVVISIIRDPNAGSTSNAGGSSTIGNIVSGTADPSEGSTELKNVEVPNLIDQFYKPSKDNWAEWLVFDPTYEYSDEIEADKIMGQSIEPGEMVSKGTVIKITVSRGKDTITVPYFNGVSIDQYKLILEKEGLIADQHFKFVKSEYYQYGQPNTVVAVTLEGKNVVPNTTKYSKSKGQMLIISYIPDGAEQTTTEPIETTTEPPEITEPTESTEPTETTTENIDTTTTTEETTQPTETTTQDGEW